MPLHQEQRLPVAVVPHRPGGPKAPVGHATHRLGPGPKTIRSWTFDSNGGFGEETWNQSGNRYTIRAKYTLPDGGSASAVNVLTYVTDDKCTWKSVNREIDGSFLPDIGEVTLVRKSETGNAKGGN